jgi:hypothetical protein
MAELTLQRYSQDDDSTLGILYLDGVFQCYTLEDEEREIKVAGETRIPEGTYDIKLRTEGGLTQKYAKKFPDMHKGMLWLQDVPNFEWVYIHLGNTDEHTEGCILVGNQVNNNKVDEAFLGDSKRAYKKLYPKLVDIIESGEQLTIEITEIGI